MELTYGAELVKYMAICHFQLFISHFYSNMRVINTLLLASTNYALQPSLRSDSRCTDEGGVCQDSDSYDCEDGAYSAFKNWCPVTTVGNF